MKEKDLTTHCGIYCGDCPRYKARFADLSGELLAEFDKSGFSELSKVISTKNDIFKQYPDMISLLQVISDLKCDVPCRQGADWANPAVLFNATEERVLKAAGNVLTLSNARSLIF